MTTRRPAHRVLDWNHDESGGWVLYRRLMTPITQQPVTLEWWFEPEREGGPSPTFQYTVYHEDIPKHVLLEYDWVEVDKLASFTGLSVKELLARSAHPEAAARASVMLDIVAYYGSNELDQYPALMTGAELRKRWPKIFRGLSPSAMWTEARKAARRSKE